MVLSKSRSCSFTKEVPEIAEEVEVSSDNQPCRHAKKNSHGIYEVSHAIILRNEGGYNSAAACMQCVMEGYRRVLEPEKHNKNLFGIL